MHACETGVVLLCCCGCAVLYNACRTHGGLRVFSHSDLVGRADEPTRGALPGLRSQQHQAPNRSAVWGGCWGGCKVSHTTTRCRPIFPGWSGALSSLNHYAVGGVFLSVSSLTWLTEITWGASGTTCEWLRKGSEKARRGGCVPWITSGLEMYGQTAAMMLSFARSMPFEK